MKLTFLGTRGEIDARTRQSVNSSNERSVGAAISVRFSLCLYDVGTEAGAAGIDSAHPVVIERVRT